MCVYVEKSVKYLRGCAHISINKLFIPLNVGCIHTSDKNVCCIIFNTVSGWWALLYVWLRKFVLFRSSLVVMRHDSEQQVCFTDTATYRYMKEIEKVIHGPYYLNHQIVLRLSHKFGWRLIICLSNWLYIKWTIVCEASLNSCSVVVDILSAVYLKFSRQVITLLTTIHRCFIT